MGWHGWHACHPLRGSAFYRSSVPQQEDHQAQRQADHRADHRVDDDPGRILHAFLAVIRVSTVGALDVTEQPWPERPAPPRELHRAGIWASASRARRVLSRRRAAAKLWL